MTEKVIEILSVQSSEIMRKQNQLEREETNAALLLAWMTLW